ncbi:hypothetical protein Cs7R123_32680 [Catellatospora sp. TT07R-123]|uniref:hypothetical protein n=1 Tax=Catellatospora sp. TT07R-123 TaxID=2733863 RepID=UPI001B213071|nr:hypothetical protein [Catellatospora sp. TT07R-123]GHJ45926.1 hypothetical protein Cs7R123_32680 [Catellatospora sp. TT07R-123]
MSPVAKTSKKVSDAGKPELPLGVQIVSSQLRSTNLDRDASSAPLDHIHVGARAQDMIERVAAALDDATRTRAWSLTGPYGMGKSTLALLLQALLGPDPDRQAEADKRVSAVSATLAQRFAAARERQVPKGMLTAVTTARREPLVVTVARALRLGVDRYWTTRTMPRPVAKALARLESDNAASTEVLEALACICDHAPVLLVIDEFGKSLEHLAFRGDNAEAKDDVFLLQEIAESGAGAQGLPLFLMTLQHMSFQDYAAHSSGLQSREWAKIQGRFEDVTLTAHIGDAIQLMARTLDSSGVDATGRKRIIKYAAVAARAWQDHGLDGVLPADDALFSSVYPLHPITAVVAPLLAAQIGQHDRSITGFLASDEPHTVRRFITDHETAKPKIASTVHISDVYDYFLTAGRTSVLASSNASRWIEIDSRINEAHGLSSEDEKLLKTIGVLNLIDASGALRASEEMIYLAISEPDELDDSSRRHRLKERLDELVDQGDFLVYREFSDEYRVWRGSDVDLGARIKEIVDKLDDHSKVTGISRFLPGAVVAGKHSQQTGILRHFVTKATDPQTRLESLPTVEDAADGTLIFHFGEPLTVPRISSELPVVVGTTTALAELLQAAGQFVAIEELLRDVTLDSVARRELTERSAQVSADVAGKIATAFSPTADGTTWHLVKPNTEDQTSESIVLRGRSMASIVSAACDAVFTESPRIRNEMLGRHELTSQGAKARRELMTAMIDHPRERHLGVEGYGPERAMYSGVLHYLGIHDIDDTEPDSDADEIVRFAFRPPQPGSTLAPAWNALHAALRKEDRSVSVQELFDLLAKPPYGVKKGIAPVVILTALLLGDRDLAVFEEGSFKPRVTADLAERITKAPGRFAIRSMATDSGPRKAALTALAAALGLNDRAVAANIRNAAPVAVARALLDRYRALTPYAVSTRRTSAQAQQVRAALSTAQEIDGLLFVQLPQALGLEPINREGRTDKAMINTYARRLAEVMDELASLQDELASRVVATAAEAFQADPHLTQFRKDLARNVAGLQGVGGLEPSVQGLVNLATNTELDDESWLDPLVLRIAGRGINQWRDTDEETFVQQARALARSVDRVSHILEDRKTLAADEAVTSHVITLTSGSGDEDRAIVHVPDAKIERGRSLASDVARQAREALGANGARILLALLAQEVLSDQQSEA